MPIYAAHMTSKLNLNVLQAPSDRIAKFKMRMKSIKKKIRMRQGGGGDAAITDQSNNNARKTKMLSQIVARSLQRFHNEWKHRELDPQ